MFLNNECETNNIMNKEELMNQIMSDEFAITELTLYLDNHPEDQKALALHNKYCNDLNNVKTMYQKMYGPLSIDYPCNSWRWIEEPWPWEGECN